MRYLYIFILSFIFCISCVGKNINDMNLENHDVAEKIKLAGLEDEGSQDMVSLSSNKGSRCPVFSDGEAVSFHISLKRPLYVYLYDIDSEDNIFPLYFPDDRGNNIVNAGNLWVYGPNEDECFKVGGVLGKEAIKVFASDKLLPRPALSSEQAAIMPANADIYPETRSVFREKLIEKQTINPRDLVEYFRAMAESRSASLYENSMFLKTVP